jgi:hypothetical protein
MITITTIIITTIAAVIAISSPSVRCRLSWLTIIITIITTTTRLLWWFRRAPEHGRQVGGAGDSVADPALALAALD